MKIALAQFNPTVGDFAGNANGGIELRERYFHARTPLAYGWNSQIASLGAPQSASLNATMSSTMFSPLPCDQAGKSLPGPQFAVKQDAQDRKRIPEFAGFEQLSRIPLPAWT